MILDSFLKLLKEAQEEDHNVEGSLVLGKDSAQFGVSTFIEDVGTVSIDFRINYLEAEQAKIDLVEFTFKRCLNQLYKLDDLSGNTPG